MEFRILGPLEVVDGGRTIPLGGTRQRAVLAILLTRANEVVSTDRLIDELWGEQPPKAAANTLQYYVSQLRKALGADRIVTRPPGYLIRVAPGELDLERFEQLLDRGGADELREALALWRGPALADLAYERFAQPEIVRLGDLRLAALERRVEADLARGRHAEAVGELEALVAEHPLRERLRAQLMLALYRSGRQAEALEVYQQTRRALVDELGIEPSPALQELEKAILRHDRSLELAEEAAAPAPAPGRAVLVALQDEGNVRSLLALAEPLVQGRERELILVEVLTGDAKLSRATAFLHEHRTALVERGVAARAAAFTSGDPGGDVVRLVSEQDVDLVLSDAGLEVLEQGVLPPSLASVLAGAPCDVGLLLARTDADPVAGPERPVLVPFGGSEHDWAAVEVAAWIALAARASLELLGSAGIGSRRDASRLLASASILVQRVVGVPTEPVLAPPGEEGVVQAAAEAGVVVIGLSPRWRQEGLGKTRLAIARRARPPALLVRRGLRPGGLAPSESLTRFTWSLGAD